MKSDHVLIAAVPVMLAPCAQRGSAMVEFCLVASILTPMLLLMPILAKTTDVSLATTQAARYGAWEQTVHKKSGEELVTEVSNLFYTNQDTAIQTNQGALIATSDQNIFWGGAGLKTRSVTTGEGIIAIGIQERSLGGAAGAMETLIDGLGSVGSAIKDSEWDLNGGIYTINVGVNTQSSLAAKLEQTSVDCGGSESSTDDGIHSSCLIHRSAILVDSWSAEGSNHTERRTRSLVPVGALAPVGEVLAVIGKTLPIFQELESLDGAMGHVDADILPEDRTGSE